MWNKVLLSISLLLALACLGCIAPPKNYTRQSTKAIDQYSSTKPTRQFEEVRLIAVTFREVGYFTGTGSDNLMFGMLEDKAASLGADAIIDVQIDSRPAGAGELNMVWHATATAIRDTD